MRVRRTRVCRGGDGWAEAALAGENRSCGRGAAGREGYKILSLQEERDGRRRRKPDRDPSPPGPPPGRRRRADGEVGTALRSAYDRVVDEDIPPEMLDLLGKLG